MKYLIAFIALVLFSAPAFAQKLPQDAISSFFSQHVDDPDFTVVYVSGKVFELFQDIDLDVDEIEEEELQAILKVVRDVQGIRVLHTEKRVAEHYREATRRIPTDLYELLFKVRTTDGQNVTAFIQDESAVISELFMLVGTDDTFVMLSFVGAIDLNEIASLQKALND